MHYEILRNKLKPPVTRWYVQKWIDTCPTLVETHLYFYLVLRNVYAVHPVKHTPCNMAEARAGGSRRWLGPPSCPVTEPGSSTNPELASYSQKVRDVSFAYFTSSSLRIANRICM
jgi:hypothetical protein